MPDYDFTNHWFKGNAKNHWDKILPKFAPQKVLEIGSFEGASACFVIEKNDWVDDLEIYCVDPWTGGKEWAYKDMDMGEVERRFDHNISLAQEKGTKSATVHKLKGPSDLILPDLISQGHSASFDFVYVDGSHQAPDVLLDAVLGFKLLRVEGLMVFDDYLFGENYAQGRDLIRSPKIAIDAFTSIFFRKMRLLHGPIKQIYLKKTAD